MYKLFTDSVCDVEVIKKISIFNTKKELDKLFEKYPNIVKNDISAIKNYES